MRRIRFLAAVVAGTIASGAAADAPAQELGGLRDDFSEQTRLLDGEIETYAYAREEEREAISNLQRLNRELDEYLADANTAPAALIRLESEIDKAREEAYDRSRAAAEDRRSMYERMRQLAGLVREAERRGVDVVARNETVGGMWRLETEQELVGLLSLRQEGSLVSGTYQLSNGRQGSVRGTFAGDRLEMEMVDSERGVVANVEGDLDRDEGTIEGSWQALELAAGRPSAGRWTAWRLSAEELQD